MNALTQIETTLNIIYYLQVIIFPTLILVGSVCNVMTFIVMRRRRMRMSSTCLYMATLAVTDTFVLWTGCLNQWLYLIEVPTLVGKWSAACKLWTFLVVFFSDASVWIIVSMSFERYLVVSRPFNGSQMFTNRRAKWILLILLISFILIDGHYFFTLEVRKRGDSIEVCVPAEWTNEIIHKIIVYVDALKYSVIPFSISFFLNILIIRRVFRAEGLTLKTERNGEYSLVSNVQMNTNRSSIYSPVEISSLKNIRVSRRVTIMLLSVSIAFCVLSVPMSLVQIVQTIFEPNSQVLCLIIGKSIAELCKYVNHSCSFFLYALTGRIFRRELVRLFFPTRFMTSSQTRQVRLTPIGVRWPNETRFKSKTKKNFV